jgi:hypothetical protein
VPRLKTEQTLLGTCGAARFLGIHRSTLHYWRLKGAVTPTAVESGPRGPLFRYSESDLEEFRGRIDYDA